MKKVAKKTSSVSRIKKNSKILMENPEVTSLVKKNWPFFDVIVSIAIVLAILIILLRHLKLLPG